MKNKKGVAVSQVVLLIIAIVVLAIAVYLLYSSWERGGTTLSVEQCRAKAVDVCGSCCYSKQAVCILPHGQLSVEKTRQLITLVIGTLQ
jgi:flagellar basal body-associated protein FliL